MAHGGAAETGRATVPVADQLVAMSKGDLDAIVSWCPWLSRMPEVVPGGHLLGHWKDYGYEMKHAMWLNQKFIQDDRKAAVDFVRAYLDTVKWMNASRGNWEESAGLAAKAFNIPANLALSQLDRITFLAVIDDAFVQRSPPRSASRTRSRMESSLSYLGVGIQEPTASWG